MLRIPFVVQSNVNPGRFKFIMNVDYLFKKLMKFLIGILLISKIHNSNIEQQRRPFQSIMRCKSIITQCFKLVIDLIGPRLTMLITEPLRHRSAFLPIHDPRSDYTLQPFFPRTNTSN